MSLTESIKHDNVDFVIHSVTVNGKLFNVGDAIDFEYDHRLKLRKTGVIHGFNVFVFESVTRKISPSGENEASMVSLTQILGVIKCYANTSYNASLGDAIHIADIDLMRKGDILARKAKH